MKNWSPIKGSEKNPKKFKGLKKFDHFWKNALSGYPGEMTDPKESKCVEKKSKAIKEVKQDEPFCFS